MTLMIRLLLILGLLPGAITLLLPKRWIPFWLGILVLFFAWLLMRPWHTPAAAFEYVGIGIASGLNLLFIMARAIKIAFDNDREQ